MAVMTPDDYRRAAGGRRSVATRYMPASRPSGPIIAYDSFDLLNPDPTIAHFLRGGRENLAGVTVSDRMAVRNSVFFRSTSLISGSMGMLPLQMHRRRSDGTTEKAVDHPLSRVFHRKPNHYQSPSEFKSFMQLAALFDGNAFARVVRLNGEIQSLIPFPRRTVRKDVSGARFRFIHQPHDGKEEILAPDEVFHFRAPVSLDGLNGLGLLEVASDTLGLALIAEKAMTNLLRKGVMAGGAIVVKEELGDEAFLRLKESLSDQYSGADNAGDWMVLEGGAEPRPFSGSAKDAELVALRKLEAEEASRFTGVPRPLLMFDETAWGSGIEQLGLYFVVYCLLPWFVIWEEAAWRLLTPAEQKSRNGDILYAKFNERALLRGSMKDQAEFMARALGSGGGMAWSTQNEARGNFDMNPLRGGDDLPRQGTTAADISEDE